MTPKAQSPENAAAELYKRTFDSMGAIDTVWRKDDSNVVCATTHGAGPHLMNQARDFDAAVHLICETSEVASAGNLPNDIDTDEHGCVYFNVAVEGVADDPTGYGLPTHTSGPREAALKDDLSDELRALARTAGLDLD